jgi:tetratricopeptide (TPR) repeat protein
MIGSRLISSIVLAGALAGALAGTLIATLASTSGGLISVAYADPQPASSVKEAGKHFQRGVALYNEADYRAALVEFRRAYDIAPNAAVLYNIGQTYYQLQNYAAALSTLDRYLTESGATAAHRSEVEQTLATLQARVGKIAITTNLPDCEITIDDELVGKTPLREPLLVSIGRRKITAMREGRPAETRFVDVAAGDTVPITLALSDPAATPFASPGVTAAPRPSDGTGYVTTAYVATGVLGGLALITGGYAFYESRKLKDLRETFPTSQKALSDKASTVSTASWIADGLGVATVVAAAVTLKLVLSRSHAREVHVAVVPNGIQLAGTFR